MIHPFHFHTGLSRHKNRARSAGSRATATVVHMSIPDHPSDSSIEQQPSSILSGEHEHDLWLVCRGGQRVSISSELLLHATRSPAIADVVNKLKDEHKASMAGRMELSLPDDCGEAWQVARGILDDPLALEPCGLAWSNLSVVVSLADKYLLVPVLQTVESFVLMTVASQPKVYHPPHRDLDRPSPFGHFFSNGTRVELTLSLLGVLCRAHLHRAAVAMVPLYLKLLREACDKLQSRHALWRRQRSVFWQAGYSVAIWQSNYLSDLNMFKSRAMHEVSAVYAVLDSVHLHKDLEALVSGPVWRALTKEVLKVAGDLIAATNMHCCNDSDL